MLGVLAGAALFTGACATTAPPATLAATPQALAGAMQGHAVVLLGEVHDNAVQHRLRLDALRLRIEQGWRPALAFEQFDADAQPRIERAREERPRDADHLIDAATDRRGWDWALYRPFVQLALDHELPIVAANLSRAQAMRVAREGYEAVFDAAARAASGLDQLDPAVVARQQADIERSHCQALPPDAVAPMARAQIARDLTLATAIRPYAARGVVLLTGNGHVRRDAGVPIWLRDLPAGALVSIGLVEVADADDDAEDGAALAARYDVFAYTARQSRPDPCAGFKAPKTKTS